MSARLVNRDPEVMLKKHQESWRVTADYQVESSKHLNVPAPPNLRLAGVLHYSI